MKILIIFILFSHLCSAQNDTIFLKLNPQLTNYTSEGQIPARLRSINELPNDLKLKLPSKLKKVDNENIRCGVLQILQTNDISNVAKFAYIISYTSDSVVNIYLNDGYSFEFKRNIQPITIVKNDPQIITLDDWSNVKRHFLFSLIHNDSGPWYLNIRELKSYSGKIPDSDQLLILYKVEFTEQLGYSDEIILANSNEFNISKIGASRRGLCLKTRLIEINGLFFELEVNWSDKFIKVTKKENIGDLPYLSSSLNFDTTLTYLALDDTRHLIRDSSNSNKFILIDFWGSWCRPCMKDIPELKQLFNQYYSILDIISLNSKDDVSTINSIIKKNEIPYKQGKEEYRLQKYFGQAAYPTYSLILPDNQLYLVKKLSIADIATILEENMP